MCILIFFSKNIFVLGLLSLNKENVVHQDLKPENILVKKGIAGPEAFLGDVGVAKQFATQSSLMRLQTLTTRTGTEEWMAPEMKNPFLIKLGKDIDDNKIDYRKFDIFSLGLITLYCLDSPNFDRYTRLLNEKSNTLHEEYFPQLKSNMPIEFSCLLKSMLSFDWNARPSVKELYDFTTAYIVKKLIFIKR